MQTQSRFPLRVGIGAATGILNFLGWVLLILSVLPGILGSQPDLSRLVLGLAVMMSGPVLLGLTNSTLSRAFIAGFISLVCAFVITGAWSILLTAVQRSIYSLPLGTTSTLWAVNVAVLVGAVELLTQDLSRDTVGRVLRGLGLTLLIVLVFELLHNMRLSFFPDGSEPELESVTWLLAFTYSVVVGTDMIYFEGIRSRPNDPTSHAPRLLFVAINVLGGIIALVTRLAR